MWKDNCALGVEDGESSVYTSYESVTNERLSEVWKDQDAQEGGELGFSKK
jgi:hypothetical protein